MVDHARRLLRFSLECLLPALLSACPIYAAAQELPAPATLRGWIEAMKANDRGPFERVRWFCKDGQNLPPTPSACEPYGGGEQHGEWTGQVRMMRAAGYRIANIYAAIDLDAFLAEPDYRESVRQMLLERFLIAADDGWILRGARYYRGAFQHERELHGALELLRRLAGDATWIGRDFAVLRVAAALLPHGRDTPSVKALRQLAASLSERDPGFMSLRNKIHNRLDPADAAAVRAYAERLEARADYDALAQAIDAVFARPPLGPRVQELVERLRREQVEAGVVAAFAAIAPGLEAAAPLRRATAAADFMAAVRDHIGRIASERTRLHLVDLSIAAEADFSALAGTGNPKRAEADRRERVDWLKAALVAGYGAGLLSTRERDAVSMVLAGLAVDAVPLATYKSALDYAVLVPGWGTQRLRYFFGDTVVKFKPIEPLSELFIPDQLRGSALFAYAAIIDGLLRDANRLAGVRNELFGEHVGGGLRALNPGLARGVLQVGAAGAALDAYRRDGIYLLPETIADLPPIAGILTAGEGNPLSHVQLLARNLGIPNVAVDATVVPKLEANVGKPVVLAASRAGSVRLVADGPEWNALFGAHADPQDVVIRPDLAKLDLQHTDFVPLSELRADDSGRIVGPKAAKLGELKHHYPERVGKGLAIPFGAFRTQLDRPMPGADTSIFDWMVGEYRRLETLPPGSTARKDATEAFRARLEATLLALDPGEEFRTRLRQALAQLFGRDGTYGVFVRSDTNVEDLADFTGAGLNLTLPNVVGFDAIMKALVRVWASPFSARSFAWRQSRMTSPEHVYPAVLLLETVPNEKSGVMVTRDIDTGDPRWLSVAVNEGIGGAVDGQAAESLRINMDTGAVRLLADATNTTRRVALPAGGLDQIPVSGDPEVLKPDEIRALVAFVRELPQQFPPITNARGEPAPADIEFGFVRGQLRLLQIRPFLDSEKARSSDFLISLDGDLAQRLAAVTVPMGEVPVR